MDDLNLALRIRAAVEGQDAIVRLGTSFIDINKKIETLTRGLTAISGSTEGAVKEFEYLESASKKYGISLLDLSDNYVKFIAASKGTNLEGEAARKIFESVSGAMAVLGGDTITTHRAFNALSQMMSKTQIYAEELKGQLAEAIPGALQLMSSALGITTAEMLSLMKAGQLSSDALLPFAAELDKKYGQLAVSSITFTETINRIETAWTLLMKRLGDTGAWSVLTSLLDKLGQSSGVLAGAIGVGLGAALQKIIALTGAWGISAAAAVKGIAAQGTAIGALTKAIGWNTGATELAAKAALDKAKADEIAAGIAVESATASAASARASLLTASLAAQNANAGVAAQERLTAATIRNKLAADELTAAQLRQRAAAEAVIVSQNKLAASQSIAARSWSLFTGPTGIIALMVAGFAAMAYAFREQDEATKTLAKSTEEYTKSLEGMNAAQLIQLNQTSKQLVEDKKNTIKAIEDEIKSLKNEEGSLFTVTASWYGLINAAKFWQTGSQQRIQAENDLIKANEELNIIEGKRAVGISALLNTYSSLNEKVASLKSSHDALLTSQSEQKNTVELLNKIWFKSVDEIKRLGIEQENLNEINKKVDASSKQLSSATLLSNDALRTLNDTTGQSIESLRAAYQGNDEYVSSLDAKSQAVLRSIQRQVALNKEELASQAQLKLLKAEYESIEGSVKAKTEATIREATASGDLTAKREAEIEQGRQLIELAELGIQISNKEIDNINLQIAQKQEEAKINEKERDNIDKAIAKLEEERLSLEKTANQRATNIDAIKAESYAIEASNRLISQSFADNQQVIADSAIEINRLQQEYENLKASSLQFIESQQTDIWDKIKAKQEEASVAAQKMGIAFRAVYSTLGLDYEEVITGMDFDTKRMIDAFGVMSQSAISTGREIQLAFTDVLSKANTETELKALEAQLITLASTGKISGDLLAQSLAEIHTKAVELRAEVDPLQIAMDKLGIGVPEKLAAAANEAEKLYLTVKNSKAPVDEIQQAFLNYAEKALLAAENGAEVNLEQLKLEASSLNLGNAFEALLLKVKEVNAEYEAYKERSAETTEFIKSEQSELQAFNETREKQIDNTIKLLELRGQENEVAVLLADKAKEAVKNAENQLAIEGELIKSLDIRINKLFELASKEGETPEQQKYRQGLMDEADAHRRIVQELNSKLPLLEREKQQAELMAGPVGQLTRLYAEQAREHQRSADASERYHDAQVQEAEGELKLAQIKGDVAAQDEAQIKLMDRRIEQAENVARVRATEAADAEKALSAKALELAADGELSNADQKQLADMQAIVNIKKAVAESTQQNVEQLKSETKATKESTDAQKTKNKFDGESAGIAAVVAEGLATIRGEMEKLSPVAKTYYDAQLAGLLIQKGITGAMEAGRVATVALTAATSGLSQKTAEYQASAIQAAQAATRIKLEMLDNANALGDFIDSMAQAQAETRQVYFSQKVALEQTLDAIEKLDEKGSSAFNNINGAMSGLTAQANRARGEFFLLDDADLDRLQSAIDEANDKLREMQDETEEARQRLQELDAEIAAESGDNARANRLKLELDRTRDLADAEKALQAAKAQGNRDAETAYAAQISKLNQLYELKERNLNQEQQGDKNSTIQVLNQAKQIKEAWDGVGKSMHNAGAALSGVVEKSNALNKSFSALQGII